MSFDYPLPESNKLILKPPPPPRYRIRRLPSVDPYEMCPCESGKKFRWCCQKLAKLAGGRNAV